MRLEITMSPESGKTIPVFGYKPEYWNLFQRRSVRKSMQSIVLSQQNYVLPWKSRI